jgi:hypothetical protein
MAGGLAGKRGRIVRTVAVVLTLAVLLPASGESETAEQDFLQVAPLPEGIEAIEPIPGAVNTRFQDCEAVWPDGYRAWLAESVAIEGHAERGDIYGWLRTKQAFEAEACDCSAKVAPWDEVDAIYAALQSQHDHVLLKHTAIYEEQARAYRAAVERMCGGPF